MPSEEYTREAILAKIRKPAGEYEIEYPILHYIGHGFSDSYGKNGRIFAASPVGGRRAIMQDEIKALQENTPLGYKLVILSCCRSAGLQPYKPLNKHAVDFHQGSGFKTDYALQGDPGDSEAIGWKNAFGADVVIGWRNQGLFTHFAEFTRDLVNRIYQQKADSSLLQIFNNTQSYIKDGVIPDDNPAAKTYQGLVWPAAYWDYFAKYNGQHNPEGGDIIFEIEGPAFPDIYGDPAKLDAVPCYLGD